MLAAIAARTTKLTLGLLVGSVTYRNPAIAAKITTTLDIISGGRAWHGLGAGWFEEEHRAYGYDFPPLKLRFEMLEEALQISRSMFTQDQTHFKGEYFTVDGAFNNPQPIRGDIPILIGGSGERKTLRLVAKYGDGLQPVRRARPDQAPAGRAREPLRRRWSRLLGDRKDRTRADRDRTDPRRGPEEVRGRCGRAGRSLTAQRSPTSVTRTPSVSGFRR